MIRKRWFALFAILTIIAPVYSANNAVQPAIAAVNIGGMVTDAVTEKEIENAFVQLRNTTGTLSTVAVNGFGEYLFTNVEPGSYLLVASAPGYITKAVGVTVEPSSIDFDIEISLDVNEESVLQGRVSGAGSPQIVVSKTGLLLRNFNETGTLSIYCANGKLLYRNLLAANTSSFVLPKNILAHGIYLVVIRQKSATFRQRIITQ